MNLQETYDSLIANTKKVVEEQEKDREEFEFEIPLSYKEALNLVAGDSKQEGKIFDFIYDHCKKNIPGFSSWEYYDWESEVTDNGILVTAWNDNQNQIIFQEL